MYPTITKREAKELIVAYCSQEEILSTLIRLKQMKKRRIDIFGICSNIVLTQRELSISMKACFQCWQYYSGYYRYPIEGNAVLYEQVENKWEGKNGWKRKRLLQHCINVMTEAFAAKQIEDFQANERNQRS